MNSRLGKWVVVVLLVIATGSHWAVLQSLAWAGMLVTYSQTAPIAIAIQKTFDGKHPCQLCKAVRAGKESQKQHETLNLEKKLDFWLVRDASPPLHRSLSPFRRHLTESVHANSARPCGPARSRKNS